MNISDDRTVPEEARGAWMTANAFAQLRQRPLLGRDFVAADEQKGAEPVAIIGQRLWQRRFASRPDVVGQSLRINGQAATIVGVMPGTVRFPENTDVWAPLVPGDADEQRTRARASRLRTAGGRCAAAGRAGGDAGHRRADGRRRTRTRIATSSAPAWKHSATGSSAAPAGRCSAR